MQKCKAREILEGVTAVAQNFKNSFSQKGFKLAKLFKVTAVLSMRTGPKLQPLSGQMMTLFGRTQSEDIAHSWDVSACFGSTCRNFDTWLLNV